MPSNTSSDQKTTFDQRDWTVEGNVTNINNTQYVTQLPEDCIPDVAKILPYLADRSPQADALSELVIRLLQADQQRIIVCVLPGAENEIHEGLMERYDNVILPNILADYDKACPNHKLYMPWPDTKLNIDSSLSRLKSELLRKITNSTKAEDMDIPTELAKTRNHLSLRYNISYSDWSTSEQTLFEQWVDYWLKFPPLNNNKLITVFLCLHYDEDDNPGLLGRWLSPSKTAAMRKYVQTLSDNTSKNLICLDELSPLTHQHLHDWAFNICPCVDANINAGLLQAQAIKLCPSKTQKSLGDLLDGMHEALKAAYYRK